MSTARPRRRPKSKLFTIVLDYRGGTYLKQVRAASQASALAVWARQLSSDRIPGIGEATAATLAQRLREDPPVALDGLMSAWSTGTLVRGAFALINIILTERGRG